MEVVLGFGLFLFVKDLHYQRFRRRPSELLLGKGALKIYRKFTGEHPCWSAISTKLHMCSPVNLPHIFRTPFYKITSGGVLLPLAAILMFFFTWTNVFERIAFQTPIDYSEVMIIVQADISLLKAKNRSTRTMYQNKVKYDVSVLCFYW